MAIDSALESYARACRSNRADTISGLTGQSLPRAPSILSEVIARPATVAADRRHLGQTCRSRWRILGLSRATASPRRSAPRRKLHSEDRDGLAVPLLLADSGRRVPATVVRELAAARAAASLGALQPGGFHCEISWRQIW